MMMSNSATELSNPILLIGAARSGTKLLRSIINSSSSVSAIPYDINYLWRYGNEHAEDDAIPASLATSEVCQVIRKQVFRAASRPKSGVIVEKTVSNALRIPFVSRVMPDARYVFLIRDGREVTESAMRCWRTPPKLGYLWKKMACYPWRHCASYAAKRFVGLGSQLISRSHAAKSWGPRYPGIDRDVSRHPLAYVCARQWQECVHSFERHRQNLPAERIYEVRYEDLIAAPDKTAIELADWLGLPDASSVGAYARTTVSGSRVGLWAGLSGADLAIAAELLQPTLQRWGYLDRDNRQVA